MGQPEGAHVVSERTEGHISSQVLESMSMEKKAVPQEQLSGISKPPIKHVFKRRAKKQQVTDEAINKSPSNNLDKGMGQESSNATIMIGASDGSSETERTQFKNSTTMIGEDRIKGVPKPPVKHVYKRRSNARSWKLVKQ